MANFAESAPRAHLVSPAGARPGLGPPPRCARSNSLVFFVYIRRTGHVSNLVALKLRIPRHEETMHGAVAV